MLENTNNRVCYEISTLETLRYFKEHNKGLYTFTIPTYNIHKNNNTLIVTVTSNAHISFVTRNLQSTWVIREITQEIMTLGSTVKFINTTPDTKWHKMTNVKFVRKDGTEIVPEGLEDLGISEEVEI